jgi:polygalacturonase
MENSTRRRFLRTLAAGAAAPAVFAESETAWDRADAILKRIQPPAFPARDFDVTRFGARADGETDCTDGFRRAISACSQGGGGRVVVPAGRYLTGAIHLRSNVNLHVAEGATILFSRDPRRYLPAVFTRWEGMECMNYSPFIYAFGQENVAVTGGGALDGQAGPEHWWPWKGRPEHGWAKGAPHQEAARRRLMEMVERNIEVRDRTFGDGDWLRPQFIQTYRCDNVLIEGVTIRNSPMWEIHPVLCRNVTVRNVKVATHGPNNDGCNPESSSDVLIDGCYFDTGDDCIALKSGRNQDGRRLAAPCENVVVQRCRMKDGHGGVTIGSEISGGARWIFAQDCQMDSPNLDRALRIKTNAVRGGIVEHVYMRRIEVGQVADAAIHVDFHYEEGDAGPHAPVVRHIDVRDLTCRKARYALALRGFANAPIRGIRLERCDFREVERPNLLEHVEGLVLSGVKINGKPAA